MTGLSLKLFCSKVIGFGLAGALAVLVSAAFSAQVTLPRAPGCPSIPELPASAAQAGDLACLSQSQRSELLSRPVKDTILTPLDRDHHHLAALHRIKAREAEALAVADPTGGDALVAYLDGRAIESMRTQALQNEERAIARLQSRNRISSTDLKAATKAATDWIRRQPGRELPLDYQQRVIEAAETLLEQSDELQRHIDTRNELNRIFDQEVKRVQTLRG
ncbi:MAG: hypothetical protein ABIP08_02910 [Lautropia sp.]